MSMTQYVTFPFNGQNHGRKIPRQLKRAALLREQVFDCVTNAIQNRDLVELQQVLNKYLKEVPEDVRKALDRLEYGDDL